MRRTRIVAFHGLVAFVCSTLFVALAGEFLCRTVILKDAVPHTQRRFAELMVEYRKKIPDPGGRPVILGLSDSFGCAGEPKGYNFYNLLQNAIDAKGLGYSVVNLSVSGYQPNDELEMLRLWGIPYHPRVVVQGFYVGNDPEGSSPGLYVISSSGISRHEFPFNPLSPSTWDLPWMIRRMFLVWEDNWTVRREIAETSGNPAAKALRGWQMSEGSHLRIIHGMLHHFFKRYPESSSWKQVREALIESIRITREAGAQFVLVALPDQLQIEDGYQQRIFQDPKIRREDYDLTLPQKLLKQLAAEQGVKYLDLYPQFREKARGGGFFRERDTHWNEAGNRLAGQLINEWILRSGLL